MAVEQFDNSFFEDFQSLNPAQQLAIVRLFAVLKLSPDLCLAEPLIDDSSNNSFRFFGQFLEILSDQQRAG